MLKVTVVFAMLAYLLFSNAEMAVEKQSDEDGPIPLVRFRRQTEHDPESETVISKKSTSEAEGPVLPPGYNETYPFPTTMTHFKEQWMNMVNYVNNVYKPNIGQIVSRYNKKQE